MPRGYARFRLHGRTGMLRCPACSNMVVPGWRRFFSRQTRFSCPGCGVWLRFHKERRSPPALLIGVRNIWTRLGVVAIGAHALFLSFFVALAYAVCYIPHIP